MKGARPTQFLFPVLNELNFKFAGYEVVIDALKRE
jgi:hypothetical protein